ncbi:MAG: hypothetical protein KAH18_09790 [Psychromonas sp.]|nr:hypothetical protein [Psychromonas sp.]
MFNLKVFIDFLLGLVYLSILFFEQHGGNVQWFLQKSTYPNTSMPTTMLTDPLWRNLLQLKQASASIYNKLERRIAF